jgi:hypothetical protein
MYYAEHPSQIADLFLFLIVSVEISENSGNLRGKDMASEDEYNPVLGRIIAY